MAEWSQLPHRRFRRTGLPLSGGRGEPVQGAVAGRWRAPHRTDGRQDHSQNRRCCDFSRWPFRHGCHPLVFAWGLKDRPPPSTVDSGPWRAKGTRDTQSGGSGRIGKYAPSKLPGRLCKDVGNGGSGSACSGSWSAAVPESSAALMILPHFFSMIVPRAAPGGENL